MTDRIMVTCDRCGAHNRVPLARLGGRERPVCGRCREPLHVVQGRPRDVTDAEFTTLVAGSHVPVLVDCWAPWCGPCRMVAPVLEKLAGIFASTLVIAKLNVDENPRTAGQYGVSGIPTLLLFDKGRLVDRAVGALSESALTTWLHNHGIR